MVRGQISITDISIILWNINIFIQFTLSNPKFYTASLCMINTHRIKKKNTKTNVAISFSTTESNSSMFMQMSSKRISE